MNAHFYTLVRKGRPWTAARHAAEAVRKAPQVARGAFGSAPVGVIYHPENGTHQGAARDQYRADQQTTVEHFEQTEEGWR
jgi:hypothetical protein